MAGSLRPSPTRCGRTPHNQGFLRSGDSPSAERPPDCSRSERSRRPIDTPEGGRSGTLYPLPRNQPGGGARLSPCAERRTSGSGARPLRTVWESRGEAPETSYTETAHGVRPDRAPQPQLTVHCVQRDSSNASCQNGRMSALDPPGRPELVPAPREHPTKLRNRSWTPRNIWTGGAAGPASSCSARTHAISY
jgi:hypothetical protein